MAKYILDDNGRKSGVIDTSIYQRNLVIKHNGANGTGGGIYRQFQIDALKLYSEQWRTLSQAVQDDWLNYSIHRSDCFYNDYSFSGMQAFISLNSHIALATNNNLIVHISQPVFPVQPQIFPVNLAVVISAGSYFISADLSPQLNSVAIYSSDNMSPGRNKPRPCDFRLIGFIDLSVTVVDVVALFIARYGHTVAIGDKIFTKIIPFNLSTGEYSSEFIFKTIVS